MKWMIRIFYLIGFTLEYIVPILLFGVVTPLVHGKMDEGLTVMGILALCIASVIALIKFGATVRKWEKGVYRALILALMKAIPLIVFSALVGWLRDFAAALTTYMWRIIPIFIVGLLFDITAEILDTKESKE